MIICNTYSKMTGSIAMVGCRPYNTSHGGSISKYKQELIVRNNRNQISLKAHQGGSFLKAVYRGANSAVN